MDWKRKIAGGRAISDIGADVANALYWDLAVPRYSVTAEVDDGLVTLHGVVERAYGKSSAEATVRRVPGVIGVRNEIAVCVAQVKRPSIA
jgi:osmotically-inducible protein OsmY